MANFLWAIRSFAEQLEQIAHIHSYVMSDLSNSLTVTHLSWAPWAIRSQSLICPERLEWFTHIRSFVLSNF